ncbi:hypothetical protein OHB49_04130 [Streptomyces sp. NBC_01717]|uniref:hypothetical protein n=1 Tax=Streptomyces sp. NBC_01717 TaxID=2975918 RepID=UPI002E327D5D|nr:hypothetical protein [Streptomyces sp. NBC_01717]
MPLLHRLLDEAVGLHLDALPGPPRTLRGVDTRTGLPGAPPDRPVHVSSLVDSGLGPIDAQVAATVQMATEALQGALGFRSRL